MRAFPTYILGLKTKASVVLELAQYFGDKGNKGLTIRNNRRGGGGEKCLVHEFFGKARLSAEIFF